MEYKDFFLIVGSAIFAYNLYLMGATNTEKKVPITKTVENKNILQNKLGGKMAELMINIIDHTNENLKKENNKLYEDLKKANNKLCEDLREEYNKHKKTQ